MNDDKLTLRLPPDMHAAMRQAAVEDDRPLARCIREALAAWLEQRKRNAATRAELARATEKSREMP